jgi:hypothetical protein
MSPPSENSEYEQDFEPVAKDNRTTNRLSGTGDLTKTPKSHGSQVSKTEYYTESEPSPKKPEPKTGIDPVVWKQARVELKELIDKFGTNKY